MSTAVFGMATTYAQAETIVGQLKTAGFSHDDISVLLPGTRDFAHENNTRAPEGAVTGAGTGGIVGGVLGSLAGTGSLAIPGVGPFLAAGPIMAALSGAAVGSAVGGLAGAPVGMGMPEFEAKRYEGKVRSGNILISVHSGSREDANRAEDIFKRAGAHHISSASESRVKETSSKRVLPHPGLA